MERSRESLRRTCCRKFPGKDKFPACSAPYLLLFSSFSQPYIGNPPFIFFLTQSSQPAFPYHRSFAKRSYDHSRPNSPVNPTTIRYSLFTTKDFADENDTITFTLRITSQTSPFFDYVLKPMRISEIPDKEHSLVFDRVTPAGHEKDTLLVGFVYEIQHVGVGGHLDTCAPGQALKHVELNFQ